jgi:hypothetical protein
MVTLFSGIHFVFDKFKNDVVHMDALSTKFALKLRMEEESAIFHSFSVEVKPVFVSAVLSAATAATATPPACLAEKTTPGWSRGIFEGCASLVCNHGNENNWMY